MSAWAWPHSKLAYAALKRLAEGLPMFPRPFAHPMAQRHRRAVVATLRTNGYTARGDKKHGPVVTDLGRTMLERGRKPNAYKDHELAIIARDYNRLGATVLALRFGRTRGAVAQCAKRMGLTSPETYHARQRGGLGNG